jgi:hypothetical protein
VHHGLSSRASHYEGNQLTVRPVRPPDAVLLAPRLRAADMREIRASTGEEPLVAMNRCIGASELCYTLSNGADIPLAIFGLASETPRTPVRQVWLLGSDELTVHAVSFLRLSRRWKTRLHKRHTILYGYVDARNKTHIRWLAWCGFTLVRLHDRYGVERRPFYEFESTAPPGQS